MSHGWGRVTLMSCLTWRRVISSFLFSFSRSLSRIADGEAATQELKVTAVHLYPLPFRRWRFFSLRNNPTLSPIQLYLSQKRTQVSFANVCREVEEEFCVREPPVCAIEFAFHTFVCTAVHKHRSILRILNRICLFKAMLIYIKKRPQIAINGKQWCFYFFVLRVQSASTFTFGKPAITWRSLVLVVFYFFFCCCAWKCVWKTGVICSTPGWMGNARFVSDLVVKWAPNP